MTGAAMNAKFEHLDETKDLAAKFEHLDETKDLTAPAFAFLARDGILQSRLAN